MFGELDLKTEKFDSAIDRKKGILGSLTGVAKKAAIGISAAIGVAAVASVKSFADFDKGMREVFTLLPGITGREMGKMTGQVKDFAVEFGVLPNDVVPALYQSLSAGVPKKNVFEFLEVAQKAAKGGVTDLTTAVDGITSVVNNYGAKVIDATRASDLMFTTVKLGKTTFGELSASVGNVLPIAAASKVSFEDISAAMSVMSAKTGKTAESSTQLRQMLAELSKSGTATSKTFEEIAGKSFKEFIAGGGDVQGALQLLEGHAKKTGVGVNDLFGSLEAGQAALLLTGSNSKNFTAALEEMETSAGATDTAFKTMSGGLADAFDKIKGAIAVVLLEIGEHLAPVVVMLAGYLQGVAKTVIESVGPAFEMMGGVLSTIAGTISTVIDALAPFEPVFKAIAAVIATVFIPHYVALAAAAVASMVKQVASWVATQASAIAAAVVHSAQIARMVAGWVLVGTQSLIQGAKIAAAWLLALGPIGIIIAAVGAAVALIIANFDEIKRFIGRAWEWVKEKTAAVWDAIQPILKTAMRVMLAIMTGGMSEVVMFFVRNWDKIKELVAATWDRIKEIVVNAWDALIDAVKNGIGKVLGFYASLPGRILKALGDLAKLLYNAGKEIITGLLDGIKDAIEGVFDFVSGIGGKIADLKGPLDKDRKLLEPAGKAIMAGLVHGLKAEEGLLTDQLRRITGTIGSLGGGIDASLTLAPNLGGLARGVAGAAAMAGVAGPTAASSIEEHYHVHGDLVLPNITGEESLRNFVKEFKTAVRQGGGGPLGPQW